MSYGDDEDDLGGRTVVDFDPANRRADHRVDQELRVEFRSLDDFVVAYTEDISRGGLFLATDALLAVGSVVRLNLELPQDGPTVQIIARVAYVRDGTDAGDRRRGMGMEFLDVEGGPLASQLEAYLTLHVGAGEAKAAPRMVADVLLVEPDDDHARRCVQVLGRGGHRIARATTGLEALGQVLRGPPDVVISEIDLPTMDGWRLLSLVRERPSIAHLPFIFMTGATDEAIRLRAYRCGVDDVLSKPISAPDLTARLDRVLTRAQAPRRQTTRNALRGDLSHLSLASVLSFIEVERRTGQMLLVRGDEIATLYIQDGNVVHVELPAQDALGGLERLLHVLDWREGQFELTAMPVPGATRTIDTPTQFAILEHARRTDERGR